VKLYLQVNRSIYDTDEKKIAFILALFKAATPAATWREQFLKQRTDDDTGEIYLGAYLDFLDLLLKEFKDVDAKATARYDLHKALPRSKTTTPDSIY
jgi:hypothetical protein